MHGGKGMNKIGNDKEKAAENFHVWEKITNFANTIQNKRH